MRKEFKAIIAAILALWLFFMGFEIGSYVEKQKINRALPTPSSEQQTDAQTVPSADLTTDTTAPPATTAAPAASDTDQLTGIGNAIDVITTYPDNELAATTTEKPKESAAQKSETTAPDVSSLSKTQVLQRATAAINKLKSTDNMTARNQETISIRITECSAQSAVNLINNVISKKIGDKNVTYVFKNGKAVGHDDEGKEIKDEGEVTPNQVIPPTNASFTLPEAGVAAASAAKNGAFVTYTIKLAEESASLEKPIPTYNAQAVGYLKMTDLEIPGATITGADMHYPGSSVVVTVDSDGRVRQLQFHLPMDGSGSARMAFLSGTASFEGFSTQNWTFTY